MLQDLSERQGNVWPTSTGELDPPERLIVWALRRWVRGLRANDGAQWVLVWKEFGRQFNGADGTLALAGFARLMDGLQRRARRVMRLHQACCPCLSADEIALVGFVASCQGQMGSAAKARAEWLVRGDGVGDLLEAGAQLADVMDRHGMTLPQRIEATVPHEGRYEAPVTVH